METIDAVGASVVTPPMFYYGSRLSENITRTPEGFLICRNVPIARTGWQEYTADEIGAMGGSERRVRVYRSPEEVFSARSISTGEGKPVTEMHPPTFVSPFNYGSYLRGHVQNVRGSDIKDDNGEPLLMADLVIMDAGLINKIENGLREISVGYSCNYVPIGEDEYAQQDIVINHVAIVYSARAGTDVRIYDSIEKEQTMAESVTTPTSTSDSTGLSTIQAVVNFLKGLGYKSPTEVRDAESEAVKKAEEEAEKATSAQDDDDDDDDDKKTGDSRRVRDSRKTKDSRQTKDDDDKTKDSHRTKDDDDDWHQRVTDLEEKIAKMQSGDDDDNDVPLPPESEEEEEATSTDDHDLVPVETQAKEDRPKNPIPGAPQTVDMLRRMRPMVARFGTRDDRVAFNRLMAAAKGKPFNVKDNRFGYGSLKQTRKPMAVEAAEVQSGMTTDADRAKNEAAQFVNMAKQFHRKNVNEVVLNIPKMPS